MDSTLFSFDNKSEASNTLMAVPKKGRLYEKCMKLLEGAGMEHNRPPRLDVAHCISLPLTLVFLPAADIATYVGEGNVDIGITGIDVVQEANEDVNQILVYDPSYSPPSLLLIITLIMYVRRIWALASASCVCWLRCRAVLRTQ